MTDMLAAALDYITRGCAPIPVEVTRFVKSGGPLSKRLHLTDGKLANDSSACRMPVGRAERRLLADWRDLAPLIEQTPPVGAWALGALRDGLPDSVRIVPKDDPQAGKPGVIARTAENFKYRQGRPAFVLIDHDGKDMPAAVEARIKELGGFVAALTTICQGMADAGYIQRASTSTNVHNSQTGEEYPAAGEHIYLVVKDGSDAKRFLYTLHDRAWLGGLGWHAVGKAGQLLDRSIVDKMVCAPERLVFEAAPVLEPPLEQRPRSAIIHDGPALDTLSACPDLSARAAGDLKRRKAASASALKPQAEKATAAFVDERVAQAVERGDDPDKAREAAEALGDRALRPSVMLEFDNREIGPKTVADVLAAPERYVGEPLADPIEGVEYGRQTAMVLRRPSGEIFIHSFAHGGMDYRFVPDKPVIKISGGEIERIVDEAEAALIKANRGLYQRDGKIVFVSYSPARTSKGGDTLTIQITERREHALLLDMSAAAIFEKFDKRANKWVSADPPMAVVLALKEHGLGKLRFPVLHGVVTAPTMRADGSILSKPGHDAATGLLFDPRGAVFPEIPEQEGSIFWLLHFCIDQADQRTPDEVAFDHQAVAGHRDEGAGRD